MLFPVKMTTVVTTTFMMVTAVASQTPAPGAGNALPGGSSSLQETFEDWTLRCAATEKGRVCNVHQQQRHRESKQLVLATELTLGAIGAVNGVVVLPFGLRLASGAVIQIDDHPASAPVAFSTCLPVGCVIPLSFDKATVDRLRAGTALKIGATANEDGKQIALSASLKGLSSALDRLAALTQSMPATKERKK